MRVWGCRCSFRALVVSRAHSGWGHSVRRPSFFHASTSLSLSALRPRASPASLLRGAGLKPEATGGEELQAPRVQDEYSPPWPGWGMFVVAQAERETLGVAKLTPAIWVCVPALARCRRVVLPDFNADYEKSTTSHFRINLPTGCLSFSAPSMLECPHGTPRDEKKVWAPVPRA